MLLNILPLFYIDRFFYQDVEGGELEVLQGTNFSEVSINVIMVEVQHRDPAPIESLLKSKGFGNCTPIKVNLICVHNTYNLMEINNRKDIQSLLHNLRYRIELRRNEYKPTPVQCELPNRTIIDSQSSLDSYKKSPRVKKKTLWFLAIHSSSTLYFNYVKSSISSAFINNRTDLFPVVIISGPKLRFDMPEFLVHYQKKCKLLVIEHNLSFASRIKKNYVPFPNDSTIIKFPRQQHPGYLRLDIPMVIPMVKAKVCDRSLVDFEYVLYTDADTLITDKFSISDLPRPSVISIGPETVKGKASNSGVLYMNISAMRQHLPHVLNYADSIKWQSSAYDQGIIIGYFNKLCKVAEIIPNEYNWKPSWGISNKAALIHFQGVKPGMAQCLGNITDGSIRLRVCRGFGKILMGISQYCSDTYAVSYQNQILSYKFYSDLYQTSLNLPY